jgi:hypothetical protein
VGSCLRAHSPGSSPAARLGAVAVIHRFGAALNPHLHFHCVVIDGVFDVAAAGAIIFHAASGIDANAIVWVQAQVRRRLLRVVVRRGLLPDGDAHAMGQWAHGGGFSVDGSVRIEAADRAGRERLHVTVKATPRPDEFEMYNVSDDPMELSNRYDDGVHGTTQALLAQQLVEQRCAKRLVPISGEVPGQPIC